MDLHVFNEVMKRIAMYSFRIVVTTVVNIVMCGILDLCQLSKIYEKLLKLTESLGVLFNCLFLLCFHSEGSHRCCIRIHVHNIVMNALSLCYLKICTSAHANTHCVFQHIEINFFFNVSNFVRDLMAKISFSKKVLKGLY